VAVRVRVVFASFFCVMRGVVEMTLRHMRVMASLLMIASLMMLRGGMMMLGRVFVMLRCLAMVLCCFFGHGTSPYWNRDTRLVLNSPMSSLSANHLSFINSL
jgi:hypothetical protein